MAIFDGKAYFNTSGFRGGYIFSREIFPGVGLGGGSHCYWGAARLPVFRIIILLDDKFAIGSKVLREVERVVYIPTDKIPGS